MRAETQVQTAEAWLQQSTIDVPPQQVLNLPYPNYSLWNSPPGRDIPQTAVKRIERWADQVLQLDRRCIPVDQRYFHNVVDQQIVHLNRQFHTTLWIKFLLQLVKEFVVGRIAVTANVISIPAVSR